VRRELRLLRQPVRSAREDPWLWADEGVPITARRDPWADEGVPITAREDPWLWADEGVRSTVVTRAAAAATATATAIGNSPPTDTTPPDTTPPDTPPPDTTPPDTTPPDTMPPDTTLPSDTTPPDTTLPSVFLLGGEKCGSTSLAFALSRHPQVLRRLNGHGIRHLIGMGFVT
jgi:hypothetical protein